MKGSCGNVKGALYIFLRNFVFIPWAYRETTSFLKMIWLTLCSGSLTSEWQKNQKERFQNKETDRRAVTVAEKPKLEKRLHKILPSLASFYLLFVMKPHDQNQHGEKGFLSGSHSQPPAITRGVRAEAEAGTTENTAFSPWLAWFILCTWYRGPAHSELGPSVLIINVDRNVP